VKLVVELVANCEETDDRGHINCERNKRSFQGFLLSEDLPNRSINRRTGPRPKRQV
jgi:hypothetical protein